MIKNKKTLVIIDSNALVHRAFHALPELTSPQGKPVNALYGFLLVFLKVLRELDPEYIAAAFDLPGPTLKKKFYKEYKAKRAKAPDELYQQIPLIKDFLNLFCVSIFEKQGYEADDVIGTIAKQATKRQISPELEVIIVTGDLDALRLVDKNIKVFTLRRGLKDTIIYDEDKVKERYQGLNPEQLTDFRALRGDPSDNIPGVTGIGEKTAIQLLNKFGNIDKIYSLLSRGEDLEGVRESIQNKLKDYKEQAYFSQTLAEIELNVPTEFKLEDCKKENLDKDKIVKALESYGFFSLIKRLPESKQISLGNF
ncbi:hypothetical protein KKC63_00065 [Patescibacteria group bacterium]|nr:hypothetical protein [Patescibacteria group bacterium]MBU4023067.1 hypothetical protein [Patescibacteria group bacterium]MBU4078265.1 hypothetical protein [Patescibacteria group bacterium]